MADEVQIKSILEYGLMIEQTLIKQGLPKKERKKVKLAYLRIFKDGMDFANGQLYVSTK